MVNKNLYIMLGVGLALIGILIVAGIGYAQSVGDTTSIDKSYTKVPTEDLSPYIRDDFNTKYGAITLTDNKVVDGKPVGKLVEYSLINAKENILDLSIEGKATLYQDGTLFDDTNYLDNLGSTTIREGNYYIEVTKDNFVNVPDTYIKQCDIIKGDEKNGTEDIENCYDVPDKYKLVNQPIISWELYKGQTLSVGDYHWKWEGKRSLNQKVDVQPVRSNKVLSEWVWFNTSATAKIPITINTAGTIYDLNTTIIVNMNLSNATKYGANFHYVYVVYQDTTELDREIISLIDGSGNQTIRFKIQASLNATANTEYSIYVMNSTQTKRNYGSIYMVGDDFNNGNTFNTSLWSGSVSETTCTINQSDGVANIILSEKDCFRFSNTTIRGNYTVETGIVENHAWSVSDQFYPIAIANLTDCTSTQGFTYEKCYPFINLQTIGNGEGYNIGTINKSASSSKLTFPNWKPAALTYNVTAWKNDTSWAMNISNSSGSWSNSTNFVFGIADLNVGFGGRTYSDNNGKVGYQLNYIRVYRSQLSGSVTVGAEQYNNINIVGKVLTSSGTVVSGATVLILDSNGVKLGNTTSNASGDWTYAILNGSIINLTIVGYNTANISQGGSAYPYITQ